MMSCRTRSEAANRKCAGTFASIFSILLLFPLLSENVTWFGMCLSLEPLLHTESELQFPSHLLSLLYAFTCTQACVDVVLPALCSPCPTLDAIFPSDFSFARTILDALTPSSLANFVSEFAVVAKDTECDIGQ
jgi:hypothetical protein